LRLRSESFASVLEYLCDLATLGLEVSVHSFFRLESLAVDLPRPLGANDGLGLAEAVDISHHGGLRVELSSIDGPCSLPGHMSGGDDFDVGLESPCNPGDDGGASDVISVEHLSDYRYDLLGAIVLGLSEVPVQFDQNLKPLSLLNTFLPEV